MSTGDAECPTDFPTQLTIKLSLVKMDNATG